MRTRPPKGEALFYTVKLDSYRIRIKTAQGRERGTNGADRPSWLPRIAADGFDLKHLDAFMIFAKSPCADQGTSSS